MQGGQTLLQIQWQKLCRKGPGNPGGHQTEHDPAMSASKANSTLDSVKRNVAAGGGK